MVQRTEAEPGAETSPDPERRYDALVLHDDDPVATAVTALRPGDEVRVVWPDGTVRTHTVSDAIPFGHKFAVSGIPEGERILKYGEPIGLAREAIEPGRHVHTHNVESQRGRGDLG